MMLFYKCQKILSLPYKAAGNFMNPGLLTKAFACILLLWMVLVLPHVCFIDFKQKGNFANIGHLFKNSNKVSYFTNQYMEFFQQDDPHGIQDSKSRIRLIIFDAILRIMRFSYGFVNTLIVMVLTKPFHKPLQKITKNMRKFICRN